MLERRIMMLIVIFKGKGLYLAWHTDLLVCLFYAQLLAVRDADLEDLNL